MRVRPSRSIATAITTLALGAGILAVTTPAHAATSAPPWEPDSQSVGTLTFYDAAGDVIRSGSTQNAPFAAYAVGSATVHASDDQAQVNYANPDPGAATYNWFAEQAGLFTHYPLTTGPAAIQALSKTHPVTVGDAGDITLDSFESDSVLATADGYQNMVQIRMVTATGNKITQTYDAADVLIDPATHIWTQVYPAAASAPGAPTAVSATAGHASASLKWTAPASNGGAAITGYSVQYQKSGTTTWTTVAHATTTTTQTVTGLTNGSVYHFRVAAVNAVGTSAYAESGAVTPVAETTAITISGPKSVVYGKTGVISAVLKDTSTNKLLGATVVLHQRTSSKAAWTTLATVKTSATTGKASVTIKPGLARQYEWTYAGDSLRKAATSAVISVAVLQSVTVYANHTSVKHGYSVSFYGSLNPSVSGRKLYLQREYGTTWKTSGSAVTLKKQKLPNGKTAVGYVLTTKLTSKGTYHFRVYAPSVAGLSYAVSAGKTVKAT